MQSLKKFSIAKKPTPLLDTPDFHQVFGGNDGCSLPLDSQKLMRHLSAIAFPGTKFELLKPCSDFIYQAFSHDHRLEKLYIDSRFLEEVDADHPERKKKLPGCQQIIEKLESLLGVAYIWGGNWHVGIPDMKTFYPPKAPFKTLDPVVQKTWIMEGVDCSGLLYQATDGITPRATSLMTNYGITVPIYKKTKKEILDSLIPMDLIIISNHVFIVIEKGHVIESRGGKGVIKTSLDECYEEFLKSRSGIDNWDLSLTVKNPFIVRRWHPEVLFCLKGSF
jgi:hypothetical protein